MTDNNMTDNDMTDNDEQSQDAATRQEQASCAMDDVAVADEDLHRDKKLRLSSDGATVRASVCVVLRKDVVSIALTMLCIPSFSSNRIQTTKDPRTNSSTWLPFRNQETTTTTHRLNQAQRRRETATILRKTSNHGGKHGPHRTPTPPTSRNSKQRNNSANRCSAHSSPRSIRSSMDGRTRPNARPILRNDSWTVTPPRSRSATTKCVPSCGPITTSASGCRVGCSMPTRCGRTIARCCRMPCGATSASRILPAFCNAVRKRRCRKIWTSTSTRSPNSTSHPARSSNTTCARNRAIRNSAICITCRTPPCIPSSPASSVSTDRRKTRRNSWNARCNASCSQIPSASSSCNTRSRHRKSRPVICLPICGPELGMMVRKQLNRMWCHELGPQYCSRIGL